MERNEKDQWEDCDQDRKNAQEFFRLNGYRERENLSESAEWIRVIFCVLVIGLIVAGLVFVLF